MAKWLIKSAIHRVISLLPSSQKFNELFQERVTKSLNLGAGAFELRVDYCRRCLEDFLALHPEVTEGFTVLEVGTGWYPTVPIGLFLCGAKDIWTFDIFPLMRTDRLKTLINFFCDYDRAGKLKTILPRMLPERMAKLHEVAKLVDQLAPVEWFEKLGVHVLVRDAQKTGLPAASVDVFFSCAVLEHIPGFVLKNIFEEFKRVASPRAVMVHYIDIKDQFASFDRSISQLNFYRYSKSAWKWLESPLIPQNRLRVSDYRNLLAKSGFKLVREENHSAPANALENLSLAKEFQHYALADLLVIDTWLVAVPQPK